MVLDLGKKNTPMRRLILSFMVLLLSPLAVFADGEFSSRERMDTVISESFYIYYKVDSIDINPTYLQNKENLAHIRNYLKNSPRIDSITIYAWASPEGGYKRNVWLSKERAKTAKRFLLETAADSSRLSSDKIKISPLAENWEGLEQIVVERYNRHDREKVLRILRDTSIGDETRKWRLQQLDNGYTWTFLKRRYMPELRAATWICVWAEVIDPLPVVAQAAQSLTAKDKGMAPPPPISTIEEKKTIFALKTNMLFDAATAVNYALELPVGEDFSVQFQQYTPWWTTRSNRHCLQFLTLGAEIRWWFKSDETLQGHFLGAHAWSGTGDLQWKKAVCYQFDFWSAGLTYGYAMPIAKWANLEFSVSAGYASIPYQHYIPTDDYEYLITDRNDAGRMHYFGPTKAEVSLVIPIHKPFRRTAR